MKKTRATSTQNQEQELKRSARAVARYLRISPRKLRLVVDTVRSKPVRQAGMILAGLNKKGARLTEKVLNSAVANAKGLELDEGRLYISDIRADGGPVFKRFMPRSMGRADRILKRTSHLSIVVTEGDRKYRHFPGTSEEEEKEVKKTKRKKKAAPRKRPAAKKKAAASKSS